VTSDTAAQAIRGLGVGELLNVNMLRESASGYTDDNFVI